MLTPSTESSDNSTEHRVQLLPACCKDWPLQVVILHFSWSSMNQWFSHNLKSQAACWHMLSAFGYNAQEDSRYSFLISNCSCKLLKKQYGSTLNVIFCLVSTKSIKDSDFRSRQLGRKRAIGSSWAEVRSNLLLTGLFNISPRTSSGPVTAKMVNWQNTTVQITNASSETALVHHQPREHMEMLAEQLLHAVSRQSQPAIYYFLQKH